MTTRMMRRGVVPVACLLLIALASGHGYPQTEKVAPETPKPVRLVDDLQPPKDDSPPRRAVPNVDPPPPVRGATPAAAQTVDELINRLEDLRKQKAELEKQEKAVVEQLRERLKSQTDRLAKLGIVPLAPEPREERKDKDADDTLPFLKK
ncbi:MAG TPA: hypothetical protein VKE40_13675 [Gemmataceae bacterium]|nr:hypothetical protein [Gemmataceae bacterium]